MMIETQVVRSKSELLKEVQALPVTKAVIYRNVDKKAWEQIVKEHQVASAVVVI
jgi:(2Fe-2S) ferredoxin